MLPLYRSEDGPLTQGRPLAQRIQKGGRISHRRAEWLEIVERKPS